MHSLICLTLWLLSQPENALGLNQHHGFQMGPVHSNKLVEDEHRWCKTKQETTHLAWVESFNTYKHALSAASIAYFSHLINTNKNNPQVLFDTVANLTQRTPTNTSSFNANEFLSLFTNKIESIRDKVNGPHPSDGTELLNTLTIAGTKTRTNCILSQFELLFPEALNNGNCFYIYNLHIIIGIQGTALLWFH